MSLHAHNFFPISSVDNSQYVIAIGLANGIIVVMRNYEDFANMEFHTGLYPICLEWSNSGGLLCVAGSRQRDGGEHSNVIKIYSIAGVTLYSTPIPCTQVGTLSDTLISKQLE